MTAPRATTLTRWLPVLAAVLSLFPLVWWAKDLRDLFWFGDEWDQLDQISSVGFWNWTLSCFGENFAPLFKLSWGGLALASGGSYFFVLCAVWCVHALCVFVLGRWLLRAGFSAFGTAAVLVVFGLAYSNIETLAWTIQLITIQGILFFMAAAYWHEAHDPQNRWTFSSIAVFALLVVLSTFSFVRGVLTGCTLAFTTVAALLARPKPDRKWRASLAVLAACLIPAAVFMTVMIRYAPGNHQHLAGAGLRQPAVFGLSYFLLGPVYKLAADGMWTTGQFVACATVKLAVLAFGWFKATPSQRRLLLTVFVFDMGNTVLLGIGRYQEPLITATSSRYQYFSLLGTLPFLAVSLDAVLRPFAFAPRWRSALGLAVLLLLVFVASRGWKRDVSNWVEGRGRETRAIVFTALTPPAEGAIPGNPSLTTHHAKELVARYHLH